MESSNGSHDCNSVVRSEPASAKSSDAMSWHIEGDCKFTHSLEEQQESGSPPGRVASELCLWQRGKHTPKKAFFVVVVKLSHGFLVFNCQWV